MAPNLEDLKKHSDSNSNKNDSNSQNLSDHVNTLRQEESSLKLIAQVPTVVQTPRTPAQIKEHNHKTAEERAAVNSAVGRQDTFVWSVAQLALSTASLFVAELPNLRARNWGSGKEPYTAEQDTILRRTRPAPADKFAREQALGFERGIRRWGVAKEFGTLATAWLADSLVVDNLSTFKHDRPTFTATAIDTVAQSAIVAAPFAGRFSWLLKGAGAVVIHTASKVLNHLIQPKDQFDNSSPIKQTTDEFINQHPEAIKTPTPAVINPVLHSDEILPTNDPDIKANQAEAEARQNRIHKELIEQERKRNTPSPTDTPTPTETPTPKATESPAPTPTPVELPTPKSP